MVIFKSESELIKTLKLYDELILQCSEGKISFSDFLVKYDSFYPRFALDGHESDEEELLLLKKYKNKIEPHKIIIEDVLGRLCSDDDAKKEIYIKAGRYGSDVALVKLKEVAQKYFKKGV